MLLSWPLASSHPSSPCSFGSRTLAPLPSLFLSEGLCTCCSSCVEHSSPNICSLFPIRQQHLHHTPPFTQFYFLHSIILLVCLFIYLLTLPLCLLHQTLWSTGAGNFFFSTSEPRALRRVPGTEEVLSKHYLKE